MVGRRRPRAHKIDTVHVVFNWHPTPHGSIDTEVATFWPSPGILWGAPGAQQPDRVLSVIFIL